MQHCPKTLSREQAKELEQPLSIEELQTALKQMKTGKSPGPDGFTLQYYKCFFTVLSPKLITTFNALASPSASVGRVLEAHITVIPKEGKDATQVQNYRPISLLNVDTKLYAKLLANRLSPLLPNLVSLDQVGFVPGREARDNTIRALNLHHWLTNSKTQGFSLSLDAEKEFDRVAWDYMHEVLRTIGLCSHMLSHISALYSSPTTSVRINGHWSGDVVYH